MSEFLGTLLIVLVLWFGGLLILGDGTSMEASTFIFYMVILYSIINPLKDFAKAGYNIPKGLASMERVDKILKAENPIKEPVNPLPLHGMNDRIEFKDLSFSYDGKRESVEARQSDGAQRTDHCTCRPVRFRQVDIGGFAAALSRCAVR